MRIKILNSCLYRTITFKQLDFFNNILFYMRFREDTSFILSLQFFLIEFDILMLTTNILNCLSMFFSQSFKMLLNLFNVRFTFNFLLMFWNVYIQYLIKGGSDQFDLFAVQVNWKSAVYKINKDRTTCKTTLLVPFKTMVHI